MSFSLSSPESEEVEIAPDSDIPETTAPSSETPVPEPPTTDTTKQELPPVEEKIVIPLEKDEEEPIGTTITLLDKEEELDDEKEKKDPHKRQQESLDYCALLPSFSSCSCAASLQEYLQRQCSVLLFRKCQTKDRKQKIPPIQTPTWHLPLSPSHCPEHKQHYSEVHQPYDKEQASEQEPEKGASPSEAQQPPGNTVESHKESMSELPLLEPSQTSTLPKPSVTDSSSAKPTPIVETPQLSSEEPTKQLRPAKSQEVLAEEKQMETSASLSSSSDAQPGVSATVDDSSVAPTEEKPHTDVSQPEISAPIQTPDVTDQSQVLHPTAAPHLEQHSDPPAVPESGTEPLQPAPDTVTEVEPSGGQAVITETKMEDLGENVSTSSSPSSPTSPSLSDIYADPPNGTEQNGNPVHGSSQKESVFMRLNNRIKALEMNMSLSGRYLEQLSQRWGTGTHKTAMKLLCSSLWTGIFSFFPPIF